MSELLADEVLDFSSNCNFCILGRMKTCNTFLDCILWCLERGDAGLLMFLSLHKFIIEGWRFRVWRGNIRVSGSLELWV